VGGVLSPLLANIALGVLDEHLAGRQTTTPAQQRRGQPSVRLIRYADDWIVLVRGTRAHAETLPDEAATALAPMGLRLSAAKTRICHLDEGVDFLGFRIQRQPKRGAPKQHAVSTWPSKKALAAVKAKVRALTRAGSNQPLAGLLGHLNRVLRRWTNYFRYRVSKATFDYLGQFTWNRVLRWLRRKHPRASWGGYAAATYPGGADPRQDGTAPPRVGNGDPLPLPRRTDPHAVDGDRVSSSPTRWACGEPDAGELARPVRRCGRGNGLSETTAPRPGPTRSRGCLGAGGCGCATNASPNTTRRGCSGPWSA
jgi:hypothetical protein